MPILNYTTSIDSYKTINEIQKMLAEAGAIKIIVDNDTEKNPSGLTFCITWRDTYTAFSLPCNYQGVYNSLQRNRKVQQKFKTKEQALRVSWRILKDWVEAQLAIVEADLAKMEEVFLPYLVHSRSGKTLYRFLNDTDEGRKLLN